MSIAKTYWVALMQELGVAPKLWRPFWSDLERRYREKHRYYHHLRHIGHFVITLESLCAPLRPRPEQLLAVFFHDAIYDPQRQDNEARSAELAAEFLRAVGLYRRYGAAVDCLIMATAGHNIDKAMEKVAAARAGSVRLKRLHIAQFLDSDLSILAASRAAYKTYCRAIALEYGHLAPEQFARGRAGFLKAFLAQGQAKCLFHSPRGYKRFEERARVNLQYELAILSRQVKGSLVEGLAS